MKTGIELITEERLRQIEKEGWTAANDDRHAQSQMAYAARDYIGHAIGLVQGLARQLTIPIKWPWGKSWWKPSQDPVRDLVKAGALIAAEIDRLQRASAAAYHQP